MGNLFTNYCYCISRDHRCIQPKATPENNILEDGPIKIIDYSGLAKYSSSINDFKNQMKHFVPYEIRCIKDSSFDTDHSYVRVTGVSQLTKKDITIEISYSLGNFVICISPYWDYDNSSKIAGILELSYKFPKNTKFHLDFKDFFDWLDNYKSEETKFEIYEECNMGKLIFKVFKSMGNKIEV
ncbi:unnamed protein product [Blepharisma stoltei]|uniref:Uncharacterized protein n=1 Tax=Blepharisma stoltei TaxID=1481888 RepID=A0AAU9I759_9CILI|nr:unnamed protein product [Blepharisma stoltei]